MKKSRPSLTAGLTTFARAAESAKSEARRLCYDPLAREFLSARGFCQIENVNGDSFKTACFKDMKQSADVSHICGFVQATVKSRG